MSDVVWYFGYGSNMSREIFLNRRAMQPLATRPGRLHDYELCFDIPVGPGERAVANLAARPGAQTWGVLHLLTADDLRRLDYTEGVGGGLYRHLSVQVWAEGIEPVTALAYQSTFTASGRKPSLRYASLLVEGAREHGLPSDYIRQLEALELAIDERPGYPQPPGPRR